MLGEALERRQLLSASYLIVRGTDHDDLITISMDLGHPDLYLVNVNNNLRWVKRDNAKDILVRALEGNDRVEIRDPRSQVTARITVMGGDGDDLLIGGDGPETLYGSLGNDTLRGNGGRNVLNGDGDNDRFGGDDLLINGDQGGNLDGGPGNDTVLGGAGYDGLLGGDGDDRLIGRGDGDDLYGDGGNDWIDGGDGHDDAFGGRGDDTIFGGNGDDELEGTQGDDELDGQAGDDILLGSYRDWLDPAHSDTSDDDLLRGGDGRDTLLGSHESDTHHDDDGKDTMIGGRGDDLLDARGDDVLGDRSLDGPLGHDHVPALDNRADSDSYVVHQTAHLEIHGRFSGTRIAYRIPAGIGQFGPHPTFFTVDSTGTLYMQDTVRRRFTLGEFFENWGFEGRSGRMIPLIDLRIWVNGKPVINNHDLKAARLVVHDGDRIKMMFGWGRL
jgi:Ca2+-binding RTX toxin-like protein